MIIITKNLENIQEFRVLGILDKSKNIWYNNNIEIIEEEIFMSRIGRLNKNDIVRGRIFDDLVEYFGNSVLGMYEGKLRVEIIDDETDEVVQFSLAPVVHKSLVDEEECDQYVPIKEKIEQYQSSLKKNEVKEKKKAK
mgnify:FL=1